MQQTCLLEQQIGQFVEKLSTNETNVQYKQTQVPEFKESLQGVFSTSENAVLPLAAGLALSGFIGGLVNRFFPLGNLALPVAGFIMMKFFKTGFLHGMGKGVLAAGFAALFGGLGGMLGGALGGAGGNDSGTQW